MSYTQHPNNACRLFFVAALLWMATFMLFEPEARAQSSEQDAPTPVTDSVISGRISPRDIGDPRATTYYFVFETRPGDLQIDVTSSDLNGDIDLFIIGSLQPLAKVTLLATGSSSQVSRTIFIREAAPVLLRVQARSNGDSTGTYTVRFGGAFLLSTQNANTATETPATQEPEVNAENRGTQRVTAVGGRIEETGERANEVARAPVLPEMETTDVGEAPAPVPSASRRLPRSPRVTRRRGARPPAPRRPRPSAPTARSAGSEETPATRPGSNARRSRATPVPKQPGVSRLIIRTRDGERIERSMSEVERIVVEGGELIIVLKSGEEQRLSLTEVLRFAIEQ